MNPSEIPIGWAIITLEGGLTVGGEVFPHDGEPIITLHIPRPMSRLMMINASHIASARRCTEDEAHNCGL